MPFHFVTLRLGQSIPLAALVVASAGLMIVAGDVAGAAGVRSERAIASVEGRAAGEPVMAIVSLRQQITIYDAVGWILRAPYRRDRADARRLQPWVWVWCERCQHHAPLACAVAVIRWGPNTSSDRLRSYARCAACGSNARDDPAPGWGGNDVGFLPFPAEKLAAH